MDGQALGVTNRALGLYGATSPNETEFEDERVIQTVDVGDLIRRGRSPAGTEGIFRCVLRNQHVDINVLATSWQPYEANDNGATVAPYLTPMPRGFDVWLLGASVSVNTGAGIDFARLSLTNVQLGFGINNSSVAVVPTTVFTLAFWNGMITAGSADFAVTETREPYKAINMRIPRKGAIASPFLVFESQSTATVQIDCLMLIGVFPEGLGQDVIGSG